MTSTNTGVTEETTSLLPVPTIPKQSHTGFYIAIAVIGIFLLIALIAGVVLLVWYVNHRTPPLPPPVPPSPTFTLPVLMNANTALVAANGYFTSNATGTPVCTLATNSLAVGWVINNQSNCTVTPVLYQAGNSTCSTTYWGQNQFQVPSGQSLNWMQTLNNGTYFTFYQNGHVAVEPTTSGSTCLSGNSTWLSNISPSTQYLRIDIAPDGSVTKTYVTLTPTS